LDFLCLTDDLDVEHTVFCGQSFRWQRDPDGSWACLFRDGTAASILVRLSLDDERVLYETEPVSSRLDFVRDYFRLDVDLQALTAAFVAADPTIAPAVAAFPGLRVIRQDPVECLFSFICSSAAPLHRIRKNITQLCRTYGDAYTSKSGQTYCTFPTVEAIAEADETVMYGFGLGYRAKFLRRAAQAVVTEGGADWLMSLRRAGYEHAKSALVSLPGVGEKIADCACIFSLDHDGAIPGDTHIRQIVERHYLPSIAGKSLTKTVYAQIGDALRDRFGPMAGWAQQYLFYQDLYEKRAWGAYEKQLDAR
jgi:N-glycosylase/DNA lyase